MLRYGIVSQSDYNTGLVRVKFDDDDIVSNWLPQIVPHSLNDKVSDPLDVNEHVACIMDERSENGVVLGAIYSSADKPSGGGNKIWSRVFADGTIIKYDQNSSKYTINLGTGSMEVTGDLKVTGKITASGDIESTSGDVIATTVSLKLHVHPGVQTGAGSTGPPTP